MEKKKIRSIFLFQLKLGRKAAETARDINEAFGPGTITVRTAQWWFKKFRGGDESLEEDERSGRPSDVDNGQLRALVKANPRTTVRELASELGVTYTTVSNHLRVIGKTKKLDEWVPLELNDNQKKRRYEVSSSLLLRNKNDPFLDRVVTYDEKWVLYDNQRRSAQWLDVDEAPRQFPNPEFHQKVMLTVWWSATGLIHYSFLNAGETITAEKYCQQMDEMHQKLRQQHPALVNRKCPILLHNAQPHVAKPTLQKLNELGYETLPHPPYSPDLSPTDYHFFKHLDNFLREKCLKKPKRYQKRLQWLHRHQNERFLRYWHKYTCFALAKVCWFWWCLFRSINFYFKPRFVHLNLKVKNRENFLVNLIVGLILKVTQKFCNILVTRGTIWLFLMLKRRSWRWHKTPDCEIPSSPDTLWVILNQFASFLGARNPQF